jgi:HprK-related kinase A
LSRTCPHHTLTSPAFISSLSPSELRAHLRSPRGLRIRFGRFVAGIRSDLDTVVRGISTLYADFPLADDDAFCDFPVEVNSPSYLRRLIRTQVIFRFEGMQPFKPLPGPQAVAMLEWGLNWVFTNHAQHYLIIHAAVLEREGAGLIMAAPPGSGKSTLCAGLALRGWRLLSDELAMIGLEDGLLTPLPRPISLKNQSIELVSRLPGQAVIGPVAHDTAKGDVAHMRPPHASVEAALDKVAPRWILFPKYDASSACEVKAMGKAQTFMELVGNSFNYPRLGASGFEAMGRLVDRCDGYTATYSSLDQIVPALESLCKRSV